MPETIPIPDNVATRGLGDSGSVAAGTSWWGWSVQNVMRFGNASWRMIPHILSM